MAGVTKQVTLTKGGSKVATQETTVLQVIGSAPGLMDGTTKPTIADAGAAPTQAQFNALLAALRTRGVIQ
ncbi:hypothetical protein [Streptomyces sp. NPDC059224]|uniref:hypothetical protein n=1 Tax=Streptomyces sp. NPDC059224 TaxID=3346775 RepID=UPI0036CD126C